MLERGISARSMSLLKRDGSPHSAVRPHSSIGYLTPREFQQYPPFKITPTEPFPRNVWAKIRDSGHGTKRETRTTPLHGESQRTPGVDPALLAHAASFEKCAACGALVQEVEARGPGAPDRAASSLELCSHRHRTVARMRATGCGQVHFPERDSGASGRGRTGTPREFQNSGLYNLHYFDWINARDSSDDIAARWIMRWIAENPAPGGNGWEPYPLSLRIVNWIKWLVR